MDPSASKKRILILGQAAAEADSLDAEDNGAPQTMSRTVYQ
jgi:hypothetical protein